MVLPDTNGYEVINQLKYNSKTRALPIYVISGYNKYKNTAIFLGAVGFLEKPIDEYSVNEVFSLFNQKVTRKIRNVLIAETEKGELDSIANVLKKKKLSVNTCNNSSEILKEISKNDYDVIILDIRFQNVEIKNMINKLKGGSQTNDKPPYIIYTDKKLTENEQEELKKENANKIYSEDSLKETILNDFNSFLDKLSNIHLTKHEADEMSLLSDDNHLIKEKKILLVDDNMKNIYALSKQLIEIGLDVEIAYNGQEALDILFSNNEFDLVIMDIMMPVMDGNTAIKHIRKHRIHRDIPIIALTAKTMTDDYRKSLEEGASEYLTKPINFERLLSVIKILLFNTIK
jgi:CheY-like chemotaxis protein